MDAQILATVIAVAASAVITSVMFFLTKRKEREDEERKFKREHYTELLSQLSKLKVSLEDRRDYYIYPGTEHDESIPITPHFQELSKAGSDALRSIRERIGPMSILLSEQTVHSLNVMIGEDWHATQSSVCSADYIQTVLVHVNAAYDNVVQEAQRELRKPTPCQQSVD